MGVQNPNNWHWVDKNCIKWARTYFEDNLVGVSATDGDTTVKINAIKSMEGDAEVCQRKGRVISLFDLHLVLSFESAESSGKIDIPEVAFDTEEDEYQFNLTFDKEGGDNARSVIRSKLIPILRSKLAEFGPELIAVHGSDIQVDESQVDSKLTKANQRMSYVKSRVTEKTIMNKASKTEGISAAAENENGVPLYNTTSLDLSAEFNTSAEQLFKTLTEPDRVSMWSRSAADIKPVEGSEYHLFGGSIEGRIEKLVPYTQIVESWRLRDWKKGHYVTVTINLDQGSDETKMTVKMDGVPIGDEELVKDNFEEKYIQSIKVTFGYGAVL